MNNFIMDIKKEKLADIERDFGHLFGNEIMLGGTKYIIVGAVIENTPITEMAVKTQGGYSISYIPNLLIMSGFNKVERLPLKEYLELKGLLDSDRKKEKRE